MSMNTRQNTSKPARDGFSGKFTGKCGCCNEKDEPRLINVKRRKKLLASQYTFFVQSGLLSPDVK